MDWDKPSIIAVVIGAAILVAWFVWGPGMTPAAPAPAQAVKTEQTVKTDTPAPAVSTVKPSPKTAIAQLPDVTIAGPEAEYTFSPNQGCVKAVKFLDHPTADGKDKIVIDFQPRPGAFDIRTAAGELTVLEVLKSRKVSDSEYVLVRRVKDQFGTTFIIDETFKAVKNYKLQAAVKIINLSKQAIAIPELRISAGDMAPWHKLSGDSVSSSQELHTVEYCTSSGKVKSVDAGAKAAKWADLSGIQTRWVGVTNRFFALLLKSADSQMAMRPERIASAKGSEEYILSATASVNAFQLTPNSGKTLDFDYYLGPKQLAQLRSFDDKASKVMHLGWFPIDFLAYIMLTMLNWLYSLIDSLGWSIILLTLLIRLIFFPVTMKANASMREMSALSPQLKAIREKYKDEPMVAQAKMAELYKEHKVNPMGGCLPMLIQIPVFIALYYALGSAAELRMQSFWWIKDLAQPDTVGHIFGIAINPLIIVWTALMIVQQKLTPTAMEPMQAKMMMAMPLVMLFILYKLPAGLTLYWSVSQIFSIAQMYYQNHIKKREEQNKSGSTPDSDPGSKPKIVRS